MSAHLNPRSVPIRLRTTREHGTAISYAMTQYQKNENLREGARQYPEKVPQALFTDRSMDGQASGCKRDDSGRRPRFQRPCNDVPTLDKAHNESKESDTDKKKSATRKRHLADEVTDDVGKGIDRSQSKAFDMHGPNSVIRVGNDILTQHEMVQLRKENREMKLKRLCKICESRNAAVVFLPCGHLVGCSGCDTKLGFTKCFHCKTIIEQRIHVQEA